MNTKAIGRRCTAALILFSILFLFTACSDADEPVSADLPADRDRLIVYTIDNETGEYSEHEAYCHMLYASSSNGESLTEIDCASLFDLLPSVREELPEISASRNEIGFYLPTLYAASFKKAEVFLTLPSGEIMTVDFNTLSEALSYAREHFSEGEEAPVIDVIMYFKNRDAGVRGTETGEEGYAFKLIP